MKDHTHHNSRSSVEHRASFGVSLAAPLPAVPTLPALLLTVPHPSSLHELQSSPLRPTDHHTPKCCLQQTIMSKKLTRRSSSNKHTSDVKCTNKQCDVPILYWKHCKSVVTASGTILQAFHYGAGVMPNTSQCQITRSTRCARHV